MEKETVKLSELTEPLELGRYDASPNCHAEVAFFLLEDGEYRARIDTRHGPLGDDIIHFDAVTVGEAIAEATGYVRLLDSNDLSRALRVAANEAQKWARRHNVDRG
jgi:hypothetical protein